MKKVLLGLAMLSWYGCSTREQPSIVAPKTIVDYGEGVYYIPATSKEFANQLATFLRQRPGLKVLSIVENSTVSGGYKWQYGYYIICERSK